MSKKFAEFLVRKFGTTDVNTILSKKSKGHQTRSAPMGKPELVPLTAEECASLCASVGMEYLSGYEGRVIKYIFSDETVDRYGDIIRQDGVDLDNFKKNPVIQLFHNYSMFSIGMSIKTWTEDKKTVGYVLFLDDRVDDSGVSERAFKMARAGVLKAGSVGFMPIEARMPTGDERAAWGMSPYGVEYTKSELLEYSLVPVPANPNALQDAISKGLITKSDLAPLVEKKLIPRGIFGKLEDATPVAKWIDEDEAHVYELRDVEQIENTKAEQIENGPIEITGQVKDTATSVTQSYVFPKDCFTAEEAKAWIEAKFAPAVTTPAQVETPVVNTHQEDDTAVRAAIASFKSAVSGETPVDVVSKALAAVNEFTKSISEILKGTGSVHPEVPVAVPVADSAQGENGLYDDPRILAAIKEIQNQVKGK